MIPPPADPTRPIVLVSQWTPDDLPKQMFVTVGAGHGLGREGGVPEQGLGAYGEVLLGFLETHAPECLSE